MNYCLGVDGVSREKKERKGGGMKKRKSFLTIHPPIEQPDWFGRQLPGIALQH